MTQFYRENGAASHDQGLLRNTASALNPLQQTAGFAKLSPTEQLTVTQAFSHILGPLLRADQAALAETSKVTKEQVLRRVEQWMFPDIRKFFDSHGNPIEIPELGEAEAACLHSFEFCEDFLTARADRDQPEKKIACGYTKKFKLVDPIRAAEFWAKLTGHLVERRMNLNMELDDLPTELIQQMKQDAETKLRLLKGNGQAPVIVSP